MRARNVKPGFFKNPDLADAGPLAQLLFVGLWCLADKEGRVKDQPRVIKAEVFPYYEVDVNGELTVLSRLGHIRRYVSSGIPVVEVLNFKKHQSPHHTEKASDLPAFDAASDCIDSTPEIHRELTVNSRKHNGGNPSDSLIPDSLNHDSPTGEQQAAPKVRATKKCPEDFEVTTDLAAIRLELPPDFDLDGETRKFRDHEFSTARKDWPATWRNWMRTARDRKNYAKRAASAPTLRVAPTTEQISQAREDAARANREQLARVMARTA